ncbi:translation initiation factor IF-2 [Striga asiatica]|uniref:Translation initiation factor IF-2 n=1 Tax=Striga asiatica TaxID=4170 RepID=A0A5A7PZ52_STRAF|nr:translation initiation factor IF-2 [Striga asiatica]
MTNLIDSGVDIVGCMNLTSLSDFESAVSPLATSPSSTTLHAPRAPPFSRASTPHTSAGRRPSQTARHTPSYIQRLDCDPKSGYLCIYKDVFDYILVPWHFHSITDRLVKYDCRSYQRKVQNKAQIRYQTQ